MKKAVITAIKGYQKTSFIRKAITRNLFQLDRSCRFTPTCSDYTIRAVQKYGVFKGSFMGMKRILRCNPWNKGGEDPVK